MKRYLLGWMVLWVASTPAAVNDRLGLEPAKKLAVENNLEVRALEREVDAEAAVLTRARSAYYPKLVGVGGADSYSQGSFQSSAPIAMVEGSINLFNGFADSSKVEASRLSVERAQVRLERLKFRVGLDVEQQFHLFLYKKETIALKEEALALNEKQQQMARQRRAGGMGSDSDILEFELRDSLLRSDLEALKQELEEARTNLKRLLGEEIAAVVEPTGTLQHQHVTAALPELVERIRKESETVLVAEKDLAIARAEGSLWRSGFLPKVDVTGRAGYLPYDLRQDPSGAGAAIGIQFRFDLFSGFETLGQRREQAARTERAEAALRQSVLRAISDMDIAYRKIMTTQDRVDLESKNLERADRYYKVVVSEYKRGIKNSVDLKVAAETLFESKVRRDTFKYDFLAQRLELERALGGPVPTEVVHDDRH